MPAEHLPVFPRQLLIGGHWLDASDGTRLTVLDPATERPIADIPSASVQDAKSAVDAAAAAAPGWAATPPRERAEVLRTAFELMTENRNQLAELISLEEGKTRAEALAEVGYAAEFFRWYAEGGLPNWGTLWA